MAATTVEGIIADLLLTHLGTLTLTPALPVSLPNIPFSPPAGPYLEARHLPNTTVNLYFADADPDMHQGIFQITVVYAARDGLIKPTEIAAQVASHFGKGTRLDGSGITVRIEDRPSIAPSMQEADRLRIPVSARYRAFA